MPLNDYIVWSLFCNRAMELKSLLTRAANDFAGIDAKELNLTIIKLKNRRQRIGLLAQACKHLVTYGPDVNLLIEPPSSEEASADDHFDSSYQSTSDHLLDTSLLRPKPKSQSLEKWLQTAIAPTLLIANFDSELNLHRLKKTMGQGVRKVALVEIEENGRCRRCAVVVLGSREEGEI